jgi:hypothetical protein
MADSHRNRSTLHRLSFACPRTVSHDGPAAFRFGVYRTARMRRTTSLFMGMSKAKVICCAIRGQPQVGFRCFMSTTAAMTSRLGPFGPGFFRTVAENSRRYFRVVSARWRRRRVEGFRTMATRTSRLGRMSSVHTPATTRSASRRLGERRRGRSDRAWPNRNKLAKSKKCDGTRNSPRTRQQMQKQDGQIAHCTILPRSRHGQRMLANFGIRHVTGQEKGKVNARPVEVFIRAEAPTCAVQENLSTQDAR